MRLAFNLHSQSKLVWVLKYELVLIGLILYESWDGIRSFRCWLNKNDFSSFPARNSPFLSTLDVTNCQFVSSSREHNPGSRNPIVWSNKLNCLLE